MLAGRLWDRDTRGSSVSVCSGYGCGRCLRCAGNVFHLLWIQPGGGHVWLNCLQSHAQRWQSIRLDLRARDLLAEGCSRCSSIMGSAESPESPGLAAHHLPGGSRPAPGGLWLLFLLVGSLIPACGASPAAEDCSSSPCLMPRRISSHAWWPWVQGENMTTLQ